MKLEDRAHRFHICPNKRCIGNRTKRLLRVMSLHQCLYCTDIQVIQDSEEDYVLLGQLEEPLGDAGISLSRKVDGQETD